MAPLPLAALIAGGPEPAPTWLHTRGGLPRVAGGTSRVGAGPYHVAFVGGSITENAGYRPLVEERLRARFPGTTWVFRNAGIASTGSTTGAFRYPGVVSEGWPLGNEATLVVVEAAVNDDQDERLSERDALWGMESIARHRPPHHITPDLLFVHFPNPHILEELRAGRVPASVAAHEAVAGHYGIPSVNVAAEVARRIDRGTLTWEQYGGTHPGPAGHALAADLIVEAIIKAAAATPADARARDHRGVPKLRADSLEVMGRTEIEDFPPGFDPGGGWAVGTPDWAALPGTCRPRFRDATLMHTTTPGSFYEIDAGGLTTMGLFVLAGPDAGAVVVEVPGEEPRVVELYHDPHSGGLHYPRTVLLFRGDTPVAGPVRLTAKVGARGGTAVRILAFCAGSIEAGEATGAAGRD